jgi:hypothetical protein
MTKQIESSTHKFTVNSHIISLLVKSQSSGLDNAVLELIMNSIDAGATKIDLELLQKNKENGEVDFVEFDEVFETIDRGTKAKRVEHRYEYILRVKDNGKGLQSKEEVINFFGDFGNPHEKGDAVFGTYRIGRGQIFNYGVCSWRSNNISISVDIHESIEDYNLTDNLPLEEGCEVSCVIYESEIESLHSLYRLLHRINYTSADIYANGKIITTKISDEAWEFENEYFYFKESEYGSLDIYNQGIGINGSRASDRYKGIILSKIPFEINMARNEINKSKCAVWKSFVEFYEKREKDQIKNDVATGAKISPFDINSYVQHYKDGNLSFDSLLKLKALWLRDGSVMGLASIFKKEIEYVTADYGKKSFSSMFDKLNQIPSVMVLGENMKYVGYRDYQNSLPKSFIKLVEFICNTVGNIIENEKESKREYNAIKNVLKGYGYSEWDSEFKKEIEEKLQHIYKNAFIYYSKASELINKYDVDKVIIKNSILSEDETMLLSCVNSANYYVAKKLGVEKRKIFVGDSFSTANAWTDGSKYIVVDIELLRRSVSSVNHIEILILSLFHEYCHNSNNALSNEHNIEFYKEYHNNFFRNSNLANLYAIINNFIFKYVNALEKKNKKIPHQFVKVKYGKKTESVSATKSRTASLQILKSNDSTIKQIKNFSFDTRPSILFFFDKKKLLSMSAKFDNLSMSMELPSSDEYIDLYLYYKDLQTDFIRLNCFGGDSADNRYFDPNEPSINERWGASTMLYSIKKIIDREMQPISKKMTTKEIELLCKTVGEMYYNEQNILEIDIELKERDKLLLRHCISMAMAQKG